MVARFETWPGLSRLGVLPFDQLPGPEPFGTAGRFTSLLVTLIEMSHWLLVGREYVCILAAGEVC